MTDDERTDQVSQIRANAALVVAELGSMSDVSNFGLDRPSLLWVEGYIERQHEHGGHNATEIGNLIGVFGSYLGECLLAAVDGHWHWSEEQQAWSIRFANGAQAYPFVKVGKLFDDGLAGGESIVSFYDIAVNYVATGRLRDTTTGSPDTPPN